MSSRELPVERLRGSRWLTEAEVPAGSAPSLPPWVRAPFAGQEWSTEPQWGSTRRVCT